jgi:hypothetical protein
MSTATSPAGTTPDDPMLDEEWLAAPRHRSWTRHILTALLAGTLCFLGGTLVQKHFGTSTADPVGPDGLATQGAGGPPAGFPGGQEDFPGALQGLPTEGSADESGDANDESAGAVVGTVVRIAGDAWVVEDLGGDRHRIRITDDTDVVRETSLTPDQVAVGDRLDISGTTSDGQLQAEAVTLR